MATAGRRQQGGGGGGRGRGQGPPDDGSSKTIQYRDFSDGLVRAGSRAGIPDSALWECINAQIIGPGQILTLTGPAPAAVTLGVNATSLWSAILNIASAEVTRIIAVQADGRITAIDPNNGTTLAICGAGVMSSDTRATVWRDSHVLFGSPSKGLGFWDANQNFFTTLPTTFTATLTATSSTATWTAGTLPNTSIVPGMDLVSVGNLPAGTSVISVVGTTITMTAAALNTGSFTITVGTGAPTKVIDLQVFQSRLWVVTSARGFAFTGPGSFTAFSTAYAGGTGLFTDSVFPGQITSFTAAMELLWATSPGAVNTISNIQVAAGVTTFQNENLVAGVGTPYGDSVAPLFRTLIFLAQAGVYAILGATPQKLSDALDGLFPSITGFGTSPAAVFTLNNIVVYAVLVTLGGLPRLLLYSRPAWSIGNQGDNLVWITSVIRATTGAIECWGTDGPHVFQLFAGASGTYSVRSKFFDYGAFTTIKTARRAAVEADASGTGVADLHLGIENETGAEVVVGTGLPATVEWINNSAAIVTWVNNLSNPVDWLTSGHLILKGTPEFSGNLLGFHVYGTNSVPLTLGSVAWELGGAGEWTFLNP